MAVPTISSVTPNTGNAGGRKFVTIAGTNFRLPPTPAPGKTDGLAQVTAAVTFGGRASTKVDVWSATEITCLVPAGAALGAVSVVVTNLDDAGVAITGEVATAVGAYTYILPNLDAIHNCTLVKVIRKLISDLSLQVLPNVALVTDVDFDPVLGTPTVIDVGKLPAIILRGPRLPENRFFSINALVERSDYVIEREPYTVDVVFEIIGSTNNFVQLLNLHAATTAFFHRNKSLGVAGVDSVDPNLVFNYDMDWDRGMQPSIGSSGGGDNSNVRSFHGTFRVVGVDIGDLGGVANDLVVGKTYTVLETILESSKLVS